MTALAEPLSATQAPPHPQQPGAARIRFHQLDGLRALAALLIMLHHSGSQRLAQILHSHGLGYLGELQAQFTRSGVELFFCMSGILLLRPYLRDKRHFDPLLYTRRRVTRLWPPFLAALLLSAAIVVIVTTKPTWWTAEYRPIHFRWTQCLAQIGIVNFGWPTYNDAWWSLTIELLFYCLVPLIVGIIAARWMTRTRLAAIAAAALALSFLMSTLTSAWAGAALTFSQLVVFAPCFATGVFMAKFDLPRRWAQIAIAIGIILCCAAVAWPRLGIHAAWALFYGGLLGILLHRSGSLTRALSSRPLVWLGERSYSLFLTHFAVFCLINYWCSRLLSSGTRFFILSRLIGYTAALLIAMLLFHLLERPFARNLATANDFWPPLGPWGRVE
jgi:peptidoglycan/LPS O-acetylase OafA/YrhL